MDSDTKIFLGFLAIVLPLVMAFLYGRELTCLVCVLVVGAILLKLYFGRSKQWLIAPHYLIGFFWLAAFCLPGFTDFARELVIYGEWNWFKILLLVCIGGSAVSSLYPFMISGSRKSLAVKLVFIMFVAGVMRDQRIYPFFYGIGFLEFAIFFLAALIIMANLVLAGQYICDLLKS